MRLPIARSILLLFTTLACSSGDAPKPGEGERAVWKPGEEWRLVPEGAIQSADGEGPAAFSRIVDIAVDPLGRVWVADGPQQQIRVFEADGRHVRTIGRAGGGPEEFATLAGMDWDAEGNLWVMDGGNVRYSVWDTAGKLVTTRRRPLNVSSVPWPLGFDSQGRLYDEEGSGHPADNRRMIVRLGPGVQVQDTFIIPAFELPVFEVVQEEGLNRRVNAVVVPFAPVQLWRLDQDGYVWVAITDRYRLERHRFEGGVERAVEHQAQPRRITRQQRETALARLRSFEEQGGKIDASRIPDTYPMFEDFFFGDGGTVWVRLPTGRDEPGRLDVFDARGRYLGQVSTSTRFMSRPAPVFRGGRVYAVVQDEDHVESIVILRLEKPGS